HHTPHSPPLPYTTLFRSNEARQHYASHSSQKRLARHSERAASHQHCPAACPPIDPRAPALDRRAARDGFLRCRAERSDRGEIELDRKSTRLNSSHLGTSY